MHKAVAGMVAILLNSFIASIAWEKVNVGQEDIGSVHVSQGNISQVVYRVEGLGVQIVEQVSR